MTNPELKEALQEMLKGDDITIATISLLQDASIHAVQKLGLSLEAATVYYGILAGAHSFMRDMLGIDTSNTGLMWEEQEVPNGLAEFLGAKKAMGLPNEKAKPEERDTFNALIKDIPLDL